MGYYSKHTLKVIKGDPFLIQQLRDENEDADEAFDTDGECQDEVKWYDREKDMTKFTKKHPTALFQLDRNGEASPDFWREYWQNGKCQKIEGKIVYEEFNKNKLMQCRY